MNKEQKLKEFNDIHRQVSVLYHEIAVKLKLSNSAFSIFYTIYEMGGSCFQKDICDLFYMSKQTIHSCMKKLEQEGYLLKKENDKHIYLTPKGEEFVKQNIAPILELEKNIFEKMTEQEGDVLLELNKKYLHYFKQNLKEIGEFL